MSVFVGAVDWLQGTLLGSLATVAASIAVAQIGFMMLTGRIGWRRGARIILGCFVLFGAPAIVSSVTEVTQGAKDAVPISLSPIVPAPSLIAEPQLETYERCPAGWCRRVFLYGWPH